MRILAIFSLYLIVLINYCKSQSFPIAQFVQSFFGDYEELPYHILRNITEGVEERLYPSLKWVCIEEFSTPERYDEKKKEMTHALFTYRKGENIKGKKMPMTMPLSTKVDHRNGDLNLYQMCFHLPKQFQNSPPAPKFNKLKIISRPEFKIYSMKFNGYADETVFVTKMLELSKLLRNNSLRFNEEDLGRRALHFNNLYSSSSKFWNQRNEIWLLAPFKNKKDSKLIE